MLLLYGKGESTQARAGFHLIKTRACRVQWCTAINKDEVEEMAGRNEVQENAGRTEVKVPVISGKNLKNVNKENGDLHPYTVVWADPAAKASTKVAADEGNSGEDPLWAERITIPLPSGVPIREAVIFVDVVHANADKETKPLVGSTRESISRRSSTRREQAGNKPARSSLRYLAADRRARSR